MIIENIQELAGLEFSIGSISAKSDCWSIYTEFDYKTHGRKKNLIHIFTDGTRYYEDDGDVFQVSEGTVLFIPDKTRCRTWSTDVCSGIGICFDIIGDIEIAQRIYFCWKDTRGDYRRLFELLNESYISTPKALLSHRSLLLRLLDLMTSESTTAARYGELLAPALRFISLHYRENLPVADYAAACNLSESYFRRIFVKYVGMTPLEYRNSLRFNEVCRLRAEGLSMTEISERCGYCDSSYLRKLFRRYTGQSIKTYTMPEIV